MVEAPSMSARVIKDPAALGWEFDPSTGRWLWGGSGSQDGGEGGQECADISIVDGGGADSRPSPIKSKNHGGSA